MIILFLMAPFLLQSLVAYDKTVVVSFGFQFYASGRCSDLVFFSLLVVLGSK